MNPLVVDILWITGLALVALVLLQTLIVIAGSIRRHGFEQTRLRQESALLDAHVATARAASAAAEDTVLAWNGYRKFEVVERVLESADVCSFVLAPHDGKRLPRYAPGQYLTFQLDVPDRDRPVIRCYSLSDAPGGTRYRVTIKRATPPPQQPDAPPGLVSNFFHEHVQQGEILDVKAPAGHFTLDPTRDEPVVLIAGGVGITPVLSMVNAIAEHNPARTTWLVCGVRSAAQNLFVDHIRSLTRRMPNLHVHVCASNPDEDDRLGVDYDHAERVSVELLRRLLPANNFRFYICGPAGMMESITHDLSAWGVPRHHVHFEAFGPATVKRTPRPSEAAASSSNAIEVTFARSQVTVNWDPTIDSLLELAERHGVCIDAGCRAGNCGTCLTAIRSGAVTYRTEPGAALEEGSCLACVCVPDSNIVLDA